MTVADEAAQLNTISQDMPLHAQQSVTAELEQLGPHVAQLLGHDHPGNQRIQELINNAMRLSGDTFQALELLGQACREVAQSLQRG
ncbi:hypothetical protein [Amycolatopsis jiangsuensis]|uniref:Uncharacterized protein n=1 Tax=Amycolatopsis jiangsuensis TaxID=1181879 RepID=A0A840J7X1_9PSEU|nr:hypothetical protein [Amycolatopsis jiangsuensis]MBB4689809.1 hypothetical protein [Amycolatopsis jiangsuensis]